MKIRLSELRRIIRLSLTEIGGGVNNAPRPVTRNPNAPSMPDREQLGRNSIKDMDDPEELSPHLLEPVYDREECFGPVPPTGKNPYAIPDPYTNDYHVIPTPPIKR